MGTILLSGSGLIENRGCKKISAG